LLRTFVSNQQIVREIFHRVFVGKVDGDDQATGLIAVQPLTGIEGLQRLPSVNGR
jgi:hypothetical protein